MFSQEGGACGEDPFPISHSISYKRATSDARLIAVVSFKSQLPFRKMALIVTETGLIICPQMHTFSVPSHRHLIARLGIRSRANSKLSYREKRKLGRSAFDDASKQSNSSS